MAHWTQSHLLGLHRPHDHSLHVGGGHTERKKSFFYLALPVPPHYLDYPPLNKHTPNDNICITYSTFSFLQQKINSKWLKQQRGFTWATDFRQGFDLEVHSGIRDVFPFPCNFLSLYLGFILGMTSFCVARWLPALIDLLASHSPLRGRGYFFFS